MPPVIVRAPEQKKPGHSAASAGELRDLPMPDDGTKQLLISGSWTLVAGALAALLTATVFGGIGPQGPHTNSGWLALLVALMCLPFGLMLFLLGAAKWLRNRSLRRKASRGA